MVDKEIPLCPYICSFVVWCVGGCVLHQEDMLGVNFLS